MNLTIAEWVPVWVDGELREVSLREALVRAHEIEELDRAEPLVAAALLALLVVIGAEVEPTPRPDGQFEALWSRGRFDPAAVDAYFDEYGDRFELFGERPFAQVGALEALSGGPKPVSLLVAEAATGNNVPLFSHSAENAYPALTSAQAARRLLATLAWDTAAIKTGVKGDPRASVGKTTGNPTGPLGQLGHVTLLGTNLFETLLLNRPADPRAQRGVPLWRREKEPGPAWAEIVPSGWAELFTWPSRRIRLFPSVIDGEVVVTGVIVAAGDRIAAIPLAFEPRTAWHRVAKPKAGKPAHEPRRHQQGVAAWRGLGALTVLTAASAPEADLPPAVLQRARELVTTGVLSETYPMRVAITGVEYGNKLAVIEDVIFDTTRLPMRSLDPAQGQELRAVLQAMAHTGLAVADALNRLGDNCRLAAGGEKVQRGKGQNPGDLLLHMLSAPAERVLAGLARDPDQANSASVAWEHVVRADAMAIAERLLGDQPDRAFRGHVYKDARGQERLMRSQLAEAYFRKALNDALPSTRPQSHLPDPEESA
ncbi:MAG: type I-E CRISPR-associated protein Cse1/CasA [Nostocoides sp.]